MQMTDSQPEHNQLYYKFLLQIVSKQHIDICGSQQNAFNNNNLTRSLTHSLTHYQTKITT
jgi:hypothetical protein